MGSTASTETEHGGDRRARALISGHKRAVDAPRAETDDASVSITIRRALTNAHAMPAMDREAADRFDAELDARLA